jgi:hypothetical protein
MNRITRNLAIILRTERLIARRRLAIAQTRTVLLALASLAALAALILLNVALFLVMEIWESPAASAGTLALGNLLLAGVLASAAGRISAEDEIAPAAEMRDLAIADIEDELDDLALEAREVVEAVKGLGANPLAGLAALIVPILTAMLNKKGE